MDEYRRTPGNLGAQILTRDLGEGRAEIITISWWPDVDHVRGFAGDDIEVAKYYLGRPLPDRPGRPVVTTASRLGLTGRSSPLPGRIPTQRGNPTLSVGCNLGSGEIPAAVGIV